MSGSAGAIFENVGLDLVDFGFKPSVSSWHDNVETGLYLTGVRYDDRFGIPVAQRDPWPATP